MEDKARNKNSSQAILAEDIINGLRILCDCEFRKHSLSPRESQVARRILNGMSKQKIAESLYVSTPTVGWHIRKIYQKMGVTSRSEFFQMMFYGMGHSKLKWRNASHLRSSINEIDI